MPNQSDWAQLERVSREELDRASRQTGEPEPSNADYIAAIRLLTEQYGYCPTEAELARLLGTKISYVNERLFELERLGLVVRAHAINGRALSRTTRVVDHPQPEPQSDPVMTPKPPEVNVDWRTTVREKLFPPKPETRVTEAFNIPPPYDPDAEERHEAAAAASVARSVEGIVNHPTAGEWAQLDRKKPQPGTKHVSRETMDVMMYSTGQLRFNEPVMAAMGHPTKMKVYWNSESSVLAMVPAADGEPGAIGYYELRTARQLYVISLNKMFKTHGLNPSMWDPREPHVLDWPDMPDFLKGGVGIVLAPRTTPRVSRKAVFR